MKLFFSRWTVNCILCIPFFFFLSISIGTSRIISHSIFQKILLWRRYLFWNPKENKNIVLPTWKSELGSCSVCVWAIENELFMYLVCSFFLPNEVFYHSFTAEGVTSDFFKFNHQTKQFRNGKQHVIRQFECHACIVVSPVTETNSSEILPRLVPWDLDTCLRLFFPSLSPFRSWIILLYLES